MIMIIYCDNNNSTDIQYNNNNNYTNILPARDIAAPTPQYPRQIHPHYVDLY